MINIKNKGQYFLILKVPGAQVTTGGPHAVSEPIPFGGIISAIFARLGSAGITGSQTTDVLLNTVTLLSSGAMLTFATTSQVPTYLDANLLVNPTAVKKGDLISLSNTAVHSGTAARDLSVVVAIQRQKGSGPPAAMETDTYDLSAAPLE